MNARAVIAAAAIALAGCPGSGGEGGTTPTTGTGTGTDTDQKADDGAPTMPRLGPGDLSGPPAEKLTQVFEELKRRVSGAADCAAYARALSSWSRDFSEAYLSLDSEVASVEFSEAELAEYQSRYEPAIVLVLEKAAECENDAQAQAAFDDFDSLMDSE